MAGVRVANLAGARVHDAVERRDEHLGRGELLAQRGEQGVESLAGIRRRLCVDRRRAHCQRHDQRRLVAVPRHVSDHDAGAAAAEAEQVVEIPADALGWYDSRGHRRIGRDDLVVRQQLHLQIVRELHLVRQTLLLDGCAHEPDVLDRRADLRGDRRDQLLVAGGERLAGSAVRQIHHAQRFGAARCGRGPHDRHRQHGAAAIHRLGVAEHLSRIDEHRVLCAEHACADAARVVDVNGRNGNGIDTEGGHGAEGVRGPVVHQDRRAPGADRLGDLAQNRARRFVQRHGATENLADRIK